MITIDVDISKKDLNQIYKLMPWCSAFISSYSLNDKWKKAFDKAAIQIKNDAFLKAARNFFLETRPHCELIRIVNVEGQPNDPKTFAELRLLSLREIKEMNKAKENIEYRNRINHLIERMEE